MPVIKSAIKKLRKDRKRTIRNAQREVILLALIKKAQKSKNTENFEAAVRLIDKSVKSHLFHRNKGSRLKSRLGKMLLKPTPRRKGKARMLGKKSKKPASL